MFGYTLNDLRPILAEWSATLSDNDLSDCTPDTGIIYKRAEAELLEVLYAAGYNPTSATPIAYQICHDLLTQGVALYFTEGHTTTSYPDSYNPIAGAFARYRAKLKAIAAGGQLGEFSQKTSHGVARCNIQRTWKGHC